MKTLIILRGLPGSGKSTFAEFITDLDYVAGVCTADDWFVKGGEYKFNPNEIALAHSYCQYKCKYLMEENRAHIVVTNTNTREWEMKPYFDLAEEYGYRVFSVIVENRHSGKNIHGVPEETIDKMRKRFEVKL